jgi:hypothetical protein
VGFDKVEWSAEHTDEKRGPGVRLAYTSGDGEEASLHSGARGLLQSCADGAISPIFDIWPCFWASQEASLGSRAACRAAADSAAADQPAPAAVH